MEAGTTTFRKALEVATEAAKPGNLTEQACQLVVQLGIIIFAAKLGGDLARRLRLPAVLGELGVGILLGPFLLGSMPFPWIGFPHGFFPHAVDAATGLAAAVPVTPELYGVATAASIVLLFMAGLETDLRQFIRYSVAGTVVGIGGIVFSFFCGAAIGSAMTGASMFQPASLFMAILCTATSVGITARILSEKKKMDSPEGVTIIAAAVVDDVLGIVCLAVVMGIVETSRASTLGDGAVSWGEIALIGARAIGVWVGATAIGLALAWRIGAFLKLFRSTTGFAALAVALAFIVSAAFEKAGLAMIIGAYILGLCLSKTDISFAIREKLHGLQLYFVPVFFTVMGMMVDVGKLTEWRVIRYGLIYAGVATLAKIVGCALPALVLGFNWLGAARIGVGMVPRGEVALIIAGIGVTTALSAPGDPFQAVLSQDLFGAAIIMTLVTTVIAPPALTWLMGRPGRGLRREAPEVAVLQTPYDFPTPRIADTIFDKVLGLIRNEGYFVSRVDSDEIYHMRKDASSFSLAREPRRLVFESGAREVPFVRMLVYESVVDMQQSLEAMRAYLKPEMIRLDLGDDPDAGRPGGAMASILSPECVTLHLRAKDKEGILAELVDMLAAAGKVRNADAVLDAVLEREGVVSTGLQYGVALPHARTDEVDRAVAAVGIRRDGVDYGSLDGEPTKLVILVVSPESGSGPHLQFLARLASRLKTEQSVRDVLLTQTPMELMEALAPPTPGRNSLRSRLGPREGV